MSVFLAIFYALAIIANFVLIWLSNASLKRMIQYRAESRQIREKYGSEIEKLNTQSTQLYETAQMFSKMGLAKEAEDALNSAKTITERCRELIKKWDDEDIELDKKFGYKPPNGEGTCPSTTTK